MRSTGRDVRVRTFVHIWLPAQSDIPRLDLLVSTIKRDLAIFGKISFNISVNISANYGLRKPLLVYLNRAGSRQMSATPFFTPHHSQPYTVSYDSYCGYNIIPHTRISYPQHRAPQSRPLKREGGNRPQLPSSRRGLAAACAWCLVRHCACRPRKSHPLGDGQWVAGCPAMLRPCLG